MRFQAISATTGYYSHAGFGSSPTLQFRVLPRRWGSLKFSDGNRLMACDLSEKTGKPLEIRALYEEQYGRDYFSDGGIWPVNVNISLTTKKLEDIVKFKDERIYEYAVGSADYNSFGESHELSIWL